MPDKAPRISLPKELRDLVLQEVEAGTHGTVNEFVRKAVRDSLRKSADERLEKLLLEGLASPKVEVTPAFWRRFYAHARKLSRASRRA